MVVLAAAAASTERIPSAIGVMVLALRDPRITSKNGRKQAVVLTGPARHQTMLRANASIYDALEWPL